MVVIPFPLAGAASAERAAIDEDLLAVIDRAAALATKDTTAAMPAGVPGRPNGANAARRAGDDSCSLAHMHPQPWVRFM